MSETAAVQEISFEYTNLADVDPKFKSTIVPEGDYKVEVVSAKRARYILNATHAAVKNGTGEVGGKGDMIKFDLIIVDHSEYSGRHVFPVLFPNGITLQQLQRIMNATGYQQEAGQPIWTALDANEQPVGTDGWLEGMERQSPRLCFETRVTVKDSRTKKNEDGTPELENDVNFKVVKPASR